MVMVSVLSGWSQNANRTGFFLELAYGGIVGETPQTSFKVENNTLITKSFKGSGLNFTFGPRWKISSIVAYEIAFEAQAPLSAIKSQPTFKFMPVSFRFTTKELLLNNSLYATIRLGGLLGFNGTYDNHNYHYHDLNITVPNMPDTNFGISDNDQITGGVAASLGIGVNVTTHLYIGATCDLQYIFDQYRGNDRKNLLWGMAGVRLGYRF